MICRKCAAQVPDGSVFCNLCGVRQEPVKRSRRRGNGLGTVYKRGQTYTAMVVLGYRPVNQGEGIIKKRAIKATKGGFRTRKEALEYLPTLMKNPSKREKTPIFIDVYDQWAKAYADKVSASTMYCYKSAIKYFKPIYAYRFDEVGVEDLQECVSDCPHTRRTKENMKALASLLFKFALPRHWSDMNYAAFVDAADDTADGTYPPFTPAQLETIRASVGYVPHAEEIYCLIYTGMRPTELFSLTASDLYTQDSITWVEGGIKTAAGKGRAVTLSPKIAPYFAARAQRPTEYLFPRDDGRRMTAEYFRDTYFYTALAAMGIQPTPDKNHKAYYVPYSCRHTFSNLIKDASGTDKDKAALMGHEDYTTTKKKYQSTDLQHLRAITDQL